MATVEIYPCGNVVVSSAASEKAAKSSMETVSRAFREAGRAPRDDVTTAESTFRITNVTAKYEKESWMINQDRTRVSLVSSFGSALVTYEIELKQKLTLKLRSKNGNVNEVTFRFNTRTIDVWGKELEEMESLFVHQVFDCVKWIPAPTPVAEGGRKTADTPQRCTRAALEHAVRAIVGDLPPGKRPNGGYLSRHPQIQQWLLQTHPGIPPLPDYDPLWGSPGRQAQKARACRAWAGKPYEAFWDNHMVPALDGSPVKEVGWSVPSASAATPAAAASTPTTAAASSAPAASSAEAGGAASSAMPPAEVAPAEVASSDSETGDLQRLQAEFEELARKLPSPSDMSAPLARLRALVTGAHDAGYFAGLLEAEVEGPEGSQLAAEQGGYTDLSAPFDEAQERPAFRSLSAFEGDESGGFEVEAPSGKKQKRSEASVAPRDVAARLLQDLEKVACPLPETAELHDECVRICMLMMWSR